MNNPFCYREMAVEAISEAIIEAMRHGDGRTRCLAAKALGTLKGRKAVSVLTGYLNDEDPDVRCDAAAALGEIGDPQAVLPLLQSLNDEVGFVRTCAIQALAKIGDPRAVEPLINAMTSTASFPYFLGELSGDYQWDIRERAVEALGRIGDPKSVEGLMDLLKDEDADLVLERIFRSLVESGDLKGQKAVISYLKDPDPMMRRKASRALIHIKNRDMIDDLMEALISGDSVVKVNIMETIEKIGGEKEIIPLLFLLKDEDSDVRIKAAEVVSRIGREKSTRYLLPLIQDPSKDVRKKISGLLSEGDSEECVVAVIHLVEDRDEGVCGEAVIGLGKNGNDRAVPPLLDLLKDKRRGKDLRSKALFALGKIGAVEGLQTIMDILRDREEEGDIREAALQILQMFPEEAILDRIQVLSNDSDEFVKKGVSRMLRGFRDPKSEEVLLFLLLNEESEVIKREAAISLAFRGNDAGLDILASLLGFSDETHVNRELTKDDENPLTLTLSPKGRGKGEGGFCDERVAGIPELFEAIGNIKNDRAVNLLLQGMKSGTPSQRCFAARAAGQTENRIFVGPLLDLLKDEDKDVRREAVIALGRLGDRRALPPLIEALCDYERFDDLRAEVARACKWIDVEAATELLLDILTDPEKKNDHWVIIETLWAIYTVS